VPSLEQVTSAANPLIKDIRKAGAKGTLTASGHWLAESFHLLEEALRSQSAIAAVLIAERALPQAERFFPRLQSTRTIALPDLVFDSIATTETSQGIMALVKSPAWTPASLFDKPSLVLVLDGLQDPGNAGATVRAAEAFGATGVIFAKGTASPGNPRTLRASAGSLFRLPFLSSIDAPQAIALLEKHDCQAFAALPWSDDTPTADAVDLTRNVALVIGSEGAGVSAAFREIARPLAIRTRQVESLNAAVAAAILLYEASRQRA
jgi:TrmH family RNA methyltransferase